MGAPEDGVGTLHTHLIRPVASLGDVFRVEKSWETSLCGAVRPGGTRLKRPALHVLSPPRALRQPGFEVEGEKGSRRAQSGGT